MIYTLVFRCFSICSNWTNFHNELVFLKDIFLKNEYPISFIDKCFKTFLDRLYLKRPKVLTAEKKTLTLVLPFLGKLSLQTRTKLQKVLKRTLSCSKIQIAFKNQRNHSNVFRFKDCLPYGLMSCVVYMVKPLYIWWNFLLWWNWQPLENKVGRAHRHFPINFQKS